MLEKQVEELQSTVQILLRDRTTAQQQMDALRQELDEAKARIAQLQTELVSILSNKIRHLRSASCWLLLETILHCKSIWPRCGKWRIEQE